MIQVDVNQARLVGGQRVARGVMRRVMRAIASEIKVLKPFKVSIAFVCAREIRRLNRVYRGKDQVTDVLSFDMDDEEFLGEVLIDYEQAKRQAKEMKHTIGNEIIFLIVHGVLHLFGHDHERPLDRKRMFTIQTRILERLGVDSRI